MTRTERIRLATLREETYRESDAPCCGTCGRADDSHTLGESRFGMICDITSDEKEGLFRLSSRRVEYGGVCDAWTARDAK